MCPQKLYLQAMCVLLVKDHVGPMHTVTSLCASYRVSYLTESPLVFSLTCLRTSSSSYSQAQSAPLSTIAAQSCDRLWCLLRRCYILINTVQKLIIIFGNHTSSVTCIRNAKFVPLYWSKIMFVPFFPSQSYFCTQRQVKSFFSN